ncbi:tail assembly protein [Ralstonia syzygii subsp. celebesensis]|uniref:Phage tail protein n=1 Tax=blood disease bacterium A2-HR MARDI TaxID=1944648 RepID=A0A1U9VDP5_9RALS|nr:tail assembly protein [Ralstonia syzygii]AQW28802.1 phage tail protein [blood disease bacterium A2-HR MARDI]QQV54651.1 tail assembly protein [Ralstonia syzygii subsp. celebesensis]
MCATSEKIRTVRLYGRLGARFGRRFELAVASPAEAIQALCVLLAGFKRELIESRDKGVTYAVFVGNRNLIKEELELPPGRGEIRIAPVLVGNKRGGVLQTILGAVLVVVGAAISYFSAGSLAAVGVGMMQMGAAMMLGGVVQMLSPQPRGLSSKDSPQNGASYNFNGPVNTSAQGNPVPLLYGEMLIGSAVISGGIYAEDQV